MERTGANESIKAVNIEQQIAEGTKKGITAEMSDAVKKGILEAWAKQPTQQGAKFSN